MRDTPKITAGLVRILALWLIFVVMTGASGAQSDKVVIRWAASSEPPFLIEYLSSAGSAWTHSSVYSLRTWTSDANGNFVPLLVDEIPSVENGGVVHHDGKSTVSFKIADWAVWSDGTPITAVDFILVYDIMTDEITTKYSGRFVNGKPVESLVQGETEKDVIINFGAPVPDVVDAAIVPLPAHMLREQYEAALAEGKGFDSLEWIRAPKVGNGPVVFDEWVPGSYIRYVKNENFWKEVHFDELIFMIYPDQTVIKQVLVNGEAEIGTISDIFDAVEFVNENADTLQLATGFAGARYELYMNSGPGGNPALRDRRVRKALAMGINRQSIADDLFGGYVKVSNSYWGDTPWYNPDTPVINYDPEGAIALLKEAGWSDEDGDGVVEARGVEGVEEGTPLTLNSYSYSDGWGGPYQAMQLVIQDNLQEIGVKVNISLVTFDQIAASYTDGGIRSTGAYDFIVDGWGVGRSSVAQREKYSCREIPGPDTPNGINYSFYCNPEVDELWVVINNSLDDTERLEAAYRIQEIFAEDVPTLQLVNMATIWLTNKNLEGTLPYSGGSQFIYNMEEWKLNN